MLAQGAGCNNNCFLWTREQNTHRDTIQVTKADWLCRGNMNERLVSHRDREGEPGQRETRGAQNGLFLCRPVSSRMFFGHHRCLDETSRHSSGWPRFSWVCEWCLSKPCWTTWRPGLQPQSLSRRTQSFKHKRIQNFVYSFTFWILNRHKCLLYKLDDILDARLHDM